MQSIPHPVAPKPSYDELVVAEANRRIEEEKQREIALAEKKRFEDDVAEQVALAKNPGHMTRAMKIQRDIVENERVVKERRDEEEKIKNRVADILARSVEIKNRADSIANETSIAWNTAVAESMQYHNYVWNGGMYNTFLIEDYITEINDAVFIIDTLVRSINNDSISDEEKKRIAAYRKRETKRHSMVSRFSSNGGRELPRRLKAGELKGASEYANAIRLNQDIRELMGVLPKAVDVMKLEINQLSGYTQTIKEKKLAEESKRIRIERDWPAYLDMLNENFKNNTPYGLTNVYKNEEDQRNLFDFTDKIYNLAGIEYRKNNTDTAFFVFLVRWCTDVITGPSCYGQPMCGMQSEIRERMISFSKN